VLAINERIRGDRYAPSLPCLVLSLWRWFLLGGGAAFSFEAVVVLDFDPKMSRDGFSLISLVTAPTSPRTFRV